MTHPFIIGGAGHDKVGGVGCPSIVKGVGWEQDMMTQSTDTGRN
jgi:hypothetical protein